MIVDAVYTWVDPHDDDWERQRASYRVSEAVERLPARAGDVWQCELYYSLLSIQQFAPWIHKVWIVCQRPQCPSFLGDFELDTEVVFHDQIFPDVGVLPSFASRAIECCLHRIPGLSEHFLYFNDDMMFGAPVNPSLFFDEWGLPIVYVESEWDPRHNATSAPHADDIPYIASCKLVRRLLNTKHGHDPSRSRILHEVAALTKTCMRVCEQTFPKQWKKCIGERFRTKDDIIPIPLSLLHGVEIHLCVKGLRNPPYVWTNLSTSLQKNHKLFLDMARKKPKFICVNDVNPSLPKEIIFHFYGCLDVYFKK